MEIKGNEYMNIIAAICEINKADFVVIATQYDVTKQKKRADIALAQARFLFPKQSCILLSKSPDGRPHLYGPKILREILQKTDLNTLPWAKYKIKEDILKDMRPINMEDN